MKPLIAVSPETVHVIVRLASTVGLKRARP